MFGSRSGQRRYATRPIAVLTASTFVAFTGLGMLSNAAADPPEKNVKVCHATASKSNPYELIMTDQSGVLGSEKGKDGHDSHTGGLYPAVGWGDIIAPFDGYVGLNWPQGEDIYNAGCTEPETDPTDPTNPPTASIELDKVTSTSGVTAEDGIKVNAGAAITWTYTVTNGPVAVTDVTLTDDKEGAITCPKSALTPGEVMTCTETGTAGAVAYTNTATVTAKVAGGSDVTARDSSGYDILPTAETTPPTVVNSPVATTPPTGGTPPIQTPVTLPAPVATNETVVVPPPAASVPEAVVVAPQAATVPEAVVVTPQLATVPEAVEVAVTPQLATIPMAAEAGGGSSSPQSSAMALLLLVVGSLGALGAGLRLMAARVR